MKEAVLFLLVSFVAISFAAPRVYSVGNTVYFVQNEPSPNLIPTADTTFRDTKSEDTSSRFEEVGDDEISSDAVGVRGPVESTSIRATTTVEPKMAEENDESRFQEVSSDEIADVVGVPVNFPYPAPTTTSDSFLNLNKLITGVKSKFFKFINKMRRFFN